MKRTWLAVLAVLPLLWLTGCSPYSSDGVVDTREIRERATINEISGTVFGAKPGTIKAIQMFQADMSEINDLDDAAWDYVYAGSSGDKPTLNLTYEGVDQSAITASIDSVIAAAQAKYDEEMAEYNQRNDELKAEKAKLEAQVAETSEGKAKFDAAVKNAEEALKQAQARVDAAVKVYNKPFNEVGPELNKLAATKGLKTAYNGNVIGRYRSIDFSKRSSNPANCPAQRNYFSVDIRDINNLCAYLSVPTEFKQAGLTDKAEAIMSKHFKAMQKAQQTLGEEGSWRTKPSGLYASLANAKENLSSTKKQAAKQFGIDRRTMYNLQRAEKQIQRISNELADRSTPEYIERSISSYYYTPDDFNDAKSAYIEAFKADLLTNRIARVSTISKTEEGVPNGAFEDIPGDLEALVTMTDLVVTFNGRRDSVRNFEVLNLMDPKVQDADRLEVKIDFDHVDQARSDDSPEKQNEKMLRALSKYAEKQKA